MLLSVFVALTGWQARADNFVTITPTDAAAATVANRWSIGGNLSGLGYIDGNSGFGGATATNFFSITGAPIPLGGSPAGFISYVPTGATTPQGSVGNALTPNTHSGLTYVAENLSLIGPLSFYTIHHRTSGDYLALIQPSTPTVSDQKPMSVPGGPATGGATGYFALSMPPPMPAAGAPISSTISGRIRWEKPFSAAWFPRSSPGRPTAGISEPAAASPTSPMQRRTSGLGSDRTSSTICAWIP